MNVDPKLTAYTLDGKSFPLCPDTVRACIAHLPAEHGMARTEAWENGFEWCRSEARKSLHQLLPKPDRAKMLVQGWIDSYSHSSFADIQLEACESFARYLLSEGLINIEKVGE